MGPGLFFRRNAVTFRSHSALPMAMNVTQWTTRSIGSAMIVS